MSKLAKFIGLFLLAAVVGNPAVHAAEAKWVMDLWCQTSQEGDDARYTLSIDVVSTGVYNTPAYREIYVNARVESSVLEHGMPIVYTLRQPEFKNAPQDSFGYKYSFEDKSNSLVLDCIRPVIGGASGSN